MKKEILEMMETYFNAELTNKVYYYLDKIIICFDNDTKVKITTRSYKGE